MSTATGVEVDRSVDPGGVWLPPSQWEIDLLAQELLEHPEVLKARAEAVIQFKSAPEFESEDGKRTLAPAVDNLLFSCLQMAVNRDPARPGLLWTARLPYSVDGHEIPDSHYGADSPDRMYRMIGVSPEYSYEITVRRHPSTPSNDDNSFEALPFPGWYGPPMVALQRNMFDVDGDTFVITADSSPADGRRNHLYLPPGTQHIAVRDTLLDWATQVPNMVDVRVVDGPERAVRDREEIVREGIVLFKGCVELTFVMVQNCMRNYPANHLVPFKRAVHWGMAGGLFGLNRFELEHDEALLVSFESLGAQYWTIAACDAWTTSIDYDRHISCLNNFQAQSNSDGSFTVAISPTDPGIHNWLDTGGNRFGAMVARWESMTEEATTRGDGAASPAAGRKPWDPENIVTNVVRECRVVKAADVLDIAPPGQDRVSSERRARMQAERAASHRVRMTGWL